MSKYFDEELAECVAAKAEGRVISKEVAMRIAATWHTPANRLVSFSTAGIVMREMVDIVNADMEDMCSRPDHFDADDSVKDMGTVPQNLVTLYALREYFESVCANLVYEEIDLGKYGDATIDEWSDGRVEITWYLCNPTYNGTDVFPGVESAREEIAGLVAERNAETWAEEEAAAAEKQEEQELVQSENPNA